MNTKLVEYLMENGILKREWADGMAGDIQKMFAPQIDHLTSECNRLDDAAKGANWQIARLVEERDELHRKHESYTKDLLENMDQQRVTIQDLRAKLERAEACAAEMRGVLEWIWDFDEMGWLNEPESQSRESECAKCGAVLPLGGHSEDCIQGKVHHALSTACGKPLLAQLSEMRQLLLDYRDKPNCGEYLMTMGWQDRVDKLTAGDFKNPLLERLERLTKYTRHLPTCESYCHPAGEHECTCGLKQVLEGDGK